MTTRALAELSIRIQNCRRCPGHLISHPSPPTPPSGPAPAQIVVMGEAPGTTERKYGQPFVGVAGVVLRELMTAAGIDPSACLFTNSVMCYPNGDPTPEMTAACRTHRFESIAVAAPRVLLVVGKVACYALREDYAALQLPMYRMQDRPWWWGRGETIDGRMQTWTDAVICYPVIHPAAGLRNISAKMALRDSLQHVAARLTWTSQQWMDAWHDTCVACGTDDIVKMDPLGTPWCEKHWTRPYDIWGRLGDHHGLKVATRKRK